MSAHGLQRLDPVGTYSTRMLPAFASVIVLGYAALQTVRHADEITSWPLVALSLGLLAVACAIFVALTLPARRLFTRANFAIVVVLTVLAALVSTFSMWGLNRFVQDDWGQIAVALMIFAAVRLRAPIDLAAAAVVSSICVGWVSAIQSGSLVLANSQFVYATVAATPILMIGLAAATFSLTIIKATMRWQRSSLAIPTESETGVAAFAADALYREQVDELSTSAVPLLEGILRTDAISSADVVAAARVSAQLRSDAVEQLGETWIDRLLTGVGEPGIRVEDADGVADRVTPEQRAVFGTLVGVLVRRRVIEVTDASICADRAGAGGRLRLRVPASAPWRTVRKGAAPYLSILRAVARDARLERLQNTVTIGFDFDLD